MNKLRLNVEALVVESFDTGSETRGGTINARGSSENGDCGTVNCIVTQFCPPTGGSCQCPRTYNPQNTCQTCGAGTCDVTCATCQGQYTCVESWDCGGSCDLTCQETACIPC